MLVLWPDELYHICPMSVASQGVLDCSTFSAQVLIPGTLALVESHRALKLSWLRALAVAMYWACCLQSPSIKELRVTAALPLLVLTALTALNRACSQVAVSPDGGEAGGGEAGGGEAGPAATVTVTVLLTLPAELVAVRV